MLLSFIIINYKTPQLTALCLESIFNTVKGIGYEIIVVDNNSEDNSETILKSKFPEIIWISNNFNEGFGRANNIGIKNANGEYVLLLNPDIILLPNTVERCLTRIQCDKEIGVLGCKLLNEDGSHQKSTYTGNGKATDILKNNIILDRLFKLKSNSFQIKALMGSFMLVPRIVFDIGGAFDPDFFLYSEEIDLCKRIQKNGFKLEYFTEAIAIHKNGGSTANKDWASKQKVLSNALLTYKYNGIINYSLFHFIFIFNSFCNFFSMWLLDKKYRNNFWLEQKYYFSNFKHYFLIPLLYSNHFGNGKRMLRRG